MGHVGYDRLPCAWLDLDYLDVATILQQPALLGLAMAAQVEQAKPSQPVFGAFLTASFKPLSALLFRTRGDGADPLAFKRDAGSAIRAPSTARG